MMTVTTRELKQNPAAAIRRVVDQGTPVTVTAHGRPTGVVLLPESSARKTWVSGHALLAAVSPLHQDTADQWQADLVHSRETAFGRVPWQDQP